MPSNSVAKVISENFIIKSTKTNHNVINYCEEKNKELLNYI